MAHISLVHIRPFNLAAGEGLGLLDDLAERVAVIGIAVEGLGVEDELAALAAPVGGGERHLAAELIRPVCLALTDAFGLRGVPGIEFPAALARLL